MGYIVKPKKQPIKCPTNKMIWYGRTETGNKIFMNAIDAQKWSHETGRPVFVRCKKYELDEA